MTQRPEIGLGTWNVYFILKLVLFIQGTIEFHFLNNLAFMAFLFLPTANKLRFLGITKQAIAIPVGLYLLHDDSFLPPLSHAVAQADNLSHFSIDYLLELAIRFVSFEFVQILFVISVFYFLFNKILRVSVLVTSAMFYLHFSNSAIVLPRLQTVQPVVTAKDAVEAITSTGNLNEQLTKAKDDFFSNQAPLKMTFDKNLAAKSNFDVLILSICSLAWEDVKHYHQENHKLFKEFDILFEHFNSATSYSGPAIIRLFHATCGQKKHDAYLGGQADKNCSLLENLKHLGFNLELMLNHEGTWENFLNLINEKAGIDVPPVKYNLPNYLLSFDGSEIYRDKDVFSQWLTHRDLNPEPKKLTFYNTISLHDGVKLRSNMTAASIDTYEQRLITLLDDIYNVLEALKKTNRPIVVLFVPEHGANTKGDKVQMAGMRELPSPGITNLPVGLKIIGNGIQRIGNQQIVKEQSSFFAIAHLVNQLLEQDVFAKTQFEPEKLLNNLPRTPMLSENEGSTVMQFNNNYYYSYNNNEWEKYDE